MISTETIENMARSVGAELYDTEMAREDGRIIYRVYIDREGGADVDLCAKVSRLLSPALDLDPPVSGAYTLEVSTPGIERKLRTLKHFQAAIGKNVKVVLKDKTSLKGALKSVEGDLIAIEGNDSINIENILKARVVFEGK